MDACAPQGAPNQLVDSYFVMSSVSYAIIRESIMNKLTLHMNTDYEELELLRELKHVEKLNPYWCMVIRTGALFNHLDRVVMIRQIIIYGLRQSQRVAV